MTSILKLKVALFFFALIGCISFSENANASNICVRALGLLNKSNFLRQVQRIASRGSDQQIRDRLPTVYVPIKDLESRGNVLKASQAERYKIGKDEYLLILPGKLSIWTESFEEDRSVFKIESDPAKVAKRLRELRGRWTLSSMIEGRARNLSSIEQSHLDLILSDPAESSRMLNDGLDTFFLTETSQLQLAYSPGSVARRVAIAGATIAIGGYFGLFTNKIVHVNMSPFGAIPMSLAESARNLPEHIAYKLQKPSEMAQYLSHLQFGMDQARKFIVYTYPNPEGDYSSDYIKHYTMVRSIDGLQGSNFYHASQRFSQSAALDILRNDSAVLRKFENRLKNLTNDSNFLDRFFKNPNLAALLVVKNGDDYQPYGGSDKTGTSIYLNSGDADPISTALRNQRRPPVARWSMGYPARALKLKVLQDFFEEDLGQSSQLISSEFVLQLLFDEKVYAHKQWPEWVDALYKAGYGAELDYLATRYVKESKRYVEWKMSRAR